MIGFGHFKQHGPSYSHNDVDCRTPQEFLGYDGFLEKYNIIVSFATNISSKELYIIVTSKEYVLKEKISSLRNIKEHSRIKKIIKRTAKINKIINEL